MKDLKLEDGKLIIGDWMFRVSGVEGLKVKVYGDKYKGRVSIVIVNGQVHVYGLLCTESLERGDLRALAKLVKGFLGQNCYYEVRFENGKEIFKEMVIK